MSKIDSRLPYSSWEAPLGITVAMKAIHDGVASDRQQKMFMTWLIEVGCRTHDMDWFPHSDRDTSFAAGRRFVGQQIIRQIKMKTGNKPTDKE